jgi:hypothetical protein
MEMNEYPQINGREVTTTEHDCPLCKAAGKTNSGGETPKLRVIVGEDRTFCIGRHGYVSAN